MHLGNQWWPRLKYISDLFFPLTLTKTLRKNIAKVKTKMQIIELQIQNSRYESRKLHPQRWWWTSLNIFIHYFYLLIPSLKNKDADKGSHPLSFLSPSGDLGISRVWRNLSPPDRHFSVRLLKSSSNWTKLSRRGPQLFSGWYQMILGVFQCSQQFPDVFRLFSDYFLMMFSDCWNSLQAELNYLWWVLSYSQDDIRWF